jgi:P-type Cu+ transporter
MNKIPRPVWPVIAGFAASAFLAAVYFGLVTWAESWQHARDLFWQERALVLPLIIGFGVQAALYTVLKLRLFVPLHSTGAPGALTGASGTTSTAAMIACCAHHVADVLPVLGLSAAAAFLAEYQKAFMVFGLLTNLAGIAIMLVVLVRARHKAAAHAEQCRLAGIEA